MSKHNNVIEFDVFLSRKTEDLELSMKVYHYLTKTGLSVFDASVSLPEIGNADYSKAIDMVLDNCKHLIVVTTSASNSASSWVEAEWRFFLNKKRAGKKIGNLLCVCGTGVLISDLPPSLQNFEVIHDSNLDRLLPYVTNDNQKWLNKEEEPNLTLIKRILNSDNKDIHEINLLKNKYPRSYFVSLLEISLLFRKGIEYLTHETSIEVWKELQKILYSRDELVYKTAFCFKVILYIEYFNKWKVSAPDNDMSYKLSIGESKLITDYLLGIELSNGAHKLIRNIYKKY